ncbi:hypothetical protein WA158_000457 [Blastocystis sp. Blastoise]
MGIIFSKLFSSFAPNKEVRILVLGLDNAGKTTILYRVQLNEAVSTVPTIGFNVETIKYKNLTFQVWDLGGQTSIRPYWRCYFPDTDAIIYVVDSADFDRLSIAHSELDVILNEDELHGVPLLVFANKQDIPGALRGDQISEGLGLTEIRDRKWTIFESDAKNGKGLTEGFDWLANELDVKN